MKPEEERKGLSKVIDVKKSYNFRHYSCIMHGVTSNNCHLFLADCDHPSAPSLELEGGESIVSHMPQMIFRQFGFDQGP